jgi:hypothetical protein
MERVGGIGLAAIVNLALLCIPEVLDNYRRSFGWFNEADSKRGLF